MRRALIDLAVKLVGAAIVAGFIAVVLRRHDATIPFADLMMAVALLGLFGMAAPSDPRPANPRPAKPRPPNPPASPKPYPGTGGKGT